MFAPSRLIPFAFALIPLPALAGTPVNPADYTQVVHVRASHLETNGNDLFTNEVLEVTIDGKHYQLTGSAPLGKVSWTSGLHPGLLPIGDYKARSLPNTKRRPDYLILDRYEILLPDGTTAIFSITGESE